jgi:hypothetical protein
MEASDNGTTGPQPTVLSSEQVLRVSDFGPTSVDWRSEQKRALS